MNNSSVSTNAQVWAVPDPIAARAPDGVGIPEAVLGEGMEAAARAASAVSRTPIGLARMVALASANMAAADRARVDNFQGANPIGLFSVLAAMSGVGKGQLAKLLMRRLNEIEAERYRAWGVECEEIADRNRSAVKGERERLPADPRRLRQDPTPEGWIRAMCEQQASLHIVAVDAHFVSDLTAATQRVDGNVGRLCAAWDGEAVSYTRARGSGPERAPDMVFHSPRVAMLNLLTPPAMAAFCSTTSVAQRGLLGRTLVADFPAPVGQVRESFTVAYVDALEAHDRALERVRSMPKDMLVPFSPGAHDEIVAADEVHGRRLDMRQESERALAARTVEMAGRIAATLALYEGAAEVSADVFRRALALAAWSEGERKRLALYGLTEGVTTRSETEAYAVRLLEWFLRRAREGKLEGGGYVSKRALLRRGPTVENGKRPRAQLRDDALQVLAERGWVRLGEADDGEAAAQLTPRWQEGDQA